MSRWSAPLWGSRTFSQDFPTSGRLDFSSHIEGLNSRPAKWRGRALVGFKQCPFGLRLEMGIHVHAIRRGGWPPPEKRTTFWLLVTLSCPYRPRAHHAEGALDGNRHLVYHTLTLRSSFGMSGQQVKSRQNRCPCHHFPLSCHHHPLIHGDQPGITANYTCPTIFVAAPNFLVAKALLNSPAHPRNHSPVRLRCSALQQPTFCGTQSPMSGLCTGTFF